MWCAVCMVGVISLDTGLASSVSAVDVRSWSWMVWVTFVDVGFFEWTVCQVMRVIHYPLVDQHTIYTLHDVANLFFGPWERKKLTNNSKNVCFGIPTTVIDHLNLWMVFGWCLEFWNVLFLKNMVSWFGITRKKIMLLTKMKYFYHVFFFCEDEWEG